MNIPQTLENTPGNGLQFDSFTRLFGGLIAKPMLQARKFLLTEVLPTLFLKDAVGAFLDLIAGCYNLKRTPECKSKGTLTFVRKDNSGELLIPKGIVVHSPIIEGRFYRLITTEDRIIPQWEKSCRVPVEAASAGSDHNLGADYYTILDKHIVGIERVYNDQDWLSVPGRNEESDDSLRERCYLCRSRLSGWYTDDSCRMMISDFAKIDPNNLYFSQETGRGAGSTDALVLLDVGTPSETFIDSINRYLKESGSLIPGDDLVVRAMPEKPVDFAITIRSISGSASASESLGMDPENPEKVSMTITVTNQADLRKMKTELKTLIRAIFRENAAFPEVARVTPMQQYGISQIGVQIHERFPSVWSVEFNRVSIMVDLEVPVLRAFSIEEE